MQHDSFLLPKKMEVNRGGGPSGGISLSSIVVIVHTNKGVPGLHIAVSQIWKSRDSGVNDTQEEPRRTQPQVLQTNLDPPRVPLLCAAFVRTPYELVTPIREHISFGHIVCLRCPSIA